MYTHSKMKFFLYMAICGLLNNSVSSYSEEFNILKNFRDLKNSTDVFDPVTGRDGFDAIQIKANDTIAMPLKDFDPPLKTLTMPYNFRAIIKIDFQYTAWCIFSIITNGIPNIALCFDIAAERTIRIYIEGLGIKNQARFADDINDMDWIDVFIRIEKNKIKIYVNCEELEEESDDDFIQDIEFQSDSILILGKFTDQDQDTYKGAIEALKITTGGDGISEVCSNGLPASTPGSLEPNTNKFIDLTPDDPFAKSDTDTNITGEKGEKGDKGDTSTVIGPLGPQGPKGETGTCQCTENDVSKILKSVVSSVPELRGPPGIAGPQGGDGHKGAKGDIGSVGLAGARGERGEPGNPGRDGGKGPKGDTGKDGAIGPPGPPGPECPAPVVEKKIEETTVPVKSEKGEMGPMGPPGVAGRMGIDGKNGEKGEKGIKGEKGDTVTEYLTYKGLDGEPGVKGDKGAPGERGLDGVKGIQGENGKPGSLGTKGDKGDKGDIGAPGLPAKLSSILDETIDPEENAAVVKKFRELPGLKGDKGEAGLKGEKGDQGLIGPQGPPGKDGVDGSHGERGLPGHKGDLGPEGPQGAKGEAGLPGAPGNVPESAIALLKGSKGDRGAPGKMGSRGHTGHPGKHGSVGPAGPKGIKGDRGSQGFKGEKGAKGLDGTHGSKGEKGETPFIDYKKVKGEKGDTGEPGTCEASACPSTPGPPGPPGPPGISLTGPKGEPGGIVPQNIFLRTGSFEDNEDMYTAATVVFKTTSILLKKTTDVPVGTIAYVIQERILLVRVENGWQNVDMGSLFSARSTSYGYAEIPESTLPSRTLSSDEKSFIRLVALNEPYPGNMLTSMNRTGRNAVNQECYRQAFRKFQANNFVAFLTNNVEDLKSLVKTNEDRVVPIVNLKGEVLFESWLQLFNGSGGPLPMSKLYSFNGEIVSSNKNWPVKAIWHGSDAYGYRTSRAFCEEWQNNNKLEFGMASPFEESKLLHQTLYPCDSKLIVLCIEATSRKHTIRRRSQSTRRSRHTRKEDFHIEP